MFKKILLLIGVLLLNSAVFAADDDFYTYLKELKNNINKEWQAPDLSSLYVTELNFNVLKDGSVKDLKIQKSSGSKTLDIKALEAVIRAGKQKPLPAVYKANSIEVTIQLSSNRTASVYTKNPKKSKQKIKTTKVMECRPVKITKVIYDKSFSGVSNFEDNMIQPVLNLDIQNAIKKN